MGQKVKDVYKRQVLTLRTRTDTYALLLSARSGSARVCLTEESFEKMCIRDSSCSPAVQTNSLPQSLQTRVLSSNIVVSPL